MRHRSDLKRSRSVSALALLPFVSALAAAPLHAQSVEVHAADPSEVEQAEQGTVNLDVTITGKGFGTGAVVTFLVAGTTNPGGIEVRNVKVRGSKKIIANIDVTEGTVPEGSESQLFDIEVQMQSGVGKGTELFTVWEAGHFQGPARSHDIPVCVTFRSDVSAPGTDAIASDGRDDDGNNVVDDYCKDQKKKTYAHIGRAYGQFRLITNTSNKFAAGRTNYIDFSGCVDSCNPPFGAGLPESTDWNTSRDLDLYTMPVDPDTSVDVAMSVRFYLVDPGPEDHWEIGFGDRHPPNDIDCTEGEPVRVTRVDAETWTIEASTQQACLDTVTDGGGGVEVVDQGRFTFPFKLTIKLQE